MIFHISRITQNKITMPQPPHTHHNHPPITPNPRTVFLSDLSVCITEGRSVALMSYLPSQKSLRFLTHHHHHHRQTPHHHKRHHKHPRLYTYAYVTDPRSPTSLPHSPEHITVTPHVHDHSYALLPPAASSTQPQAPDIASPIHSPTHSNTYMPPASSSQAKTHPHRQHHYIILKQTKWDEDFFGKDLYTYT